MIWDSHSSNIEKPNVDEKERATGFHIGTTNVQGISKGAYRRILGQVLDLNCLTWIFRLVLVEQRCFDPLHPPTFHPIFYLLHLLLGQLCQCIKGVMLQHDKYIFGNYGIKDAKGDLWAWNRKLVMSKDDGTSSHFA
jgi:hypothetical protein